MGVSSSRFARLPRAVPSPTRGSSLYAGELTLLAIFKASSIIGLLALRLALGDALFGAWAMPSLESGHVSLWRAVAFLIGHLFYITRCSARRALASARRVKQSTPPHRRRRADHRLRS